MFEMDECPFCHRMKTTVLNQPSVQEYFREHFLIFPVDVEGDVEVTDFRQQRNAEGLRAEAVPGAGDAGVRVLRSRRQHGGALYRRHPRIEEFMLLGQYVVDGAYKDTTFTKYKRAKPTTAPPRPQP